jgi:hypothetical protein
MHVSGGISLEIVNIDAFLIHLGQEKVSFFDSFRPQLLKIFYSLACSTWQGHVPGRTDDIRG